MILATRGPYPIIIPYCHHQFRHLFRNSQATSAAAAIAARAVCFMRLTAHFSADGAAANSERARCGRQACAGSLVERGCREAHSLAFWIVRTLYPYNLAGRRTSVIT